MPFREQITKASKMLISCQNTDGGISATKRGDPSGCWTTADTLESFLNSGRFVEVGISRIKRMTMFLEATQIRGNDTDKGKNGKYTNSGGWPLIQGDHACTMATGHAVGALQLARELFKDDEETTEKIDQAISRGANWLEKNQNSDGGWGSEPSAGQDGRYSRIVATYYALYGYWYRGGNFSNSAAVRMAVDFFLKSRNNDGSWGFAKGLTGDISNTARAARGLLLSSYCDSTSPLVKDAIKFIITNQEPRGLWDLAHEGFLYEDASGEVIYNNSCVFDALMFLLTADYREKETLEAIKWFLNTQEDSGFWCLSSPKRRVSDIYTWPTAEWIDVIDLASRKYVGHIARVYSTPLKWKRIIVTWVIGIIIFAETSYILGLWSLLGYWWQGLESSTRELILNGIIIALVVGLVSTFLYDQLKLLFERIRKNFVSFLSRKIER
ncbi:MAG: prenyltransferase/squalene oxidase repeat-containing protein [Chloroflexota bacterium]